MSVMSSSAANSTTSVVLLHVLPVARIVQVSGVSAAFLRRVMICPPLTMFVCVFTDKLRILPEKGNTVLKAASDVPPPVW